MFDVDSEFCTKNDPIDQDLQADIEEKTNPVN